MERLQVEHERPRAGAAHRQCAVAGRDPQSVRRVHVTYYSGPSKFVDYVEAAEKAGADEVVAVVFGQDTTVEQTLRILADATGVCPASAT